MENIAWYQIVLLLLNEDQQNIISILKDGKRMEHSRLCHSACGKKHSAFTKAIQALLAKRIIQDEIFYENQHHYSIHPNLKKI